MQRFVSRMRFKINIFKNVQWWTMCADELLYYLSDTKCTNERNFFSSIWFRSILFGAYVAYSHIVSCTHAYKHARTHNTTRTAKMAEHIASEKCMCLAGTLWCMCWLSAVEYATQIYARSHSFHPMNFFFHFNIWLTHRHIRAEKNSIRWTRFCINRTHSLLYIQTQSHISQMKNKNKWPNIKCVLENGLFSRE